jgi:hypothetical protein
MERSMFASRLDQATTAVLEYARRLVVDVLPVEVRYLIRSEVCDAPGAVERLWQSGEVPVWIDIGVDSIDDQFTYIRLNFSNLRRSREETLRYQRYGNPPFQYLSPRLPPDWKGIERSGKVHVPRRDPSQALP